MTLAELGWDDRFAAAYEPWQSKRDVQPGRVAIEFNQIFRVYVDDGELDAVTAGRLKHRAASRAELPSVGDWIALRKRASEDRGVILAMLPRRSAFTRRAAGEPTGEQVVAANVDVVFIVMGLDGDFNLRRLERYLLMARESGATPVVLLTKPDLSADLPADVAEVVAATGDVPVHVVSPKLNQGLEQVAPYMTAARTAALLGSSGVGKSTIINRLIGADVQKTREVRESDSKGRHTTTHRELVVLPDGGLMIDTPGMRELQLWDASESVRGTFEDVEALAGECHFTDCRHRGEPRCAVKTAVDEGRIPPDRLASYLHLQDELAYLARQQDERAQIEEKRKGKIGAKAMRQHVKSKRI